MKKNETMIRSKAVKEQPLYMNLLLYTVLAFVSLVIPRATVYGGLAPFGVAIVACVGGGASFFVYLCAAVGYFFIVDTLMPLRYVTAIAIVAGVRWVFGGLNKITDHILFAPLLGAAATLLSGVALNMTNGFQLGVLISELCESVLAGGAAYFFYHAVQAFRGENGPRGLTFVEQSSLVISAAVVLMAINSLELSGISVGRIVTVLLILLAAKSGGQQGGTLVGVILGSAAALSDPLRAFFTSSYAFGGMLCGLFARYGKAASAMVFVLTDILVLFSTGDQEHVVIGIYEVLASCGIFLILPYAVERVFNTIFSRTQSIPAVTGVLRSVDMRLTYAADTMNDIAKTVDAVSQKLAAMHAPTLKEVYAQVCQRLCNGCRYRERCWTNQFADSMAAFRHMGQVLRERGVLKAEDVDVGFREECSHLNELLSLMNTGYAHFVMKENAFRRLSDIRSIVTDQFEGMALLFSDMSADFQNMDRSDEQMSARVLEICRSYKLPIVQAVCLIGKRNRLTIQLLIEGANCPPNNSRFYKDLSQVCGCSFGEPEICESGFLTRIRLSEIPRLRLCFGSSQLNCRTETLCGDSFEQFYDHDGRYCVVLSDGMGTGGRAAVDGAMTAALAGRMLQAGFHFDSILRIINSSLIVKSGDESLSTLDAVCIDPFTGELRGMKAGAAPSFLYSKGRLVRICASSLPIGILKDITAEEYSDCLNSGDIFVMVSDGVTEGESEWLEELICRLAEREADEKTMASEIVFNARERQDSERGDDTTALVIRIA